MRHMYANFRKRFFVQKLKILMWKAARSTHPSVWKRVMLTIKELNIDAYRYLIVIPPRYLYCTNTLFLYKYLVFVQIHDFFTNTWYQYWHYYSCRFWSKSRFSDRAICDTIVNNMSEAFNSVIVDARGKPIITMLEEIKVYLMERWATRRKKVTTFEGNICPKVLDRLHKEKELTKYWIPRLGFCLFLTQSTYSCTDMCNDICSWSGEKLFEVRHISMVRDKYIVNVDAQHYNCRKWLLTVISCCHAITAMNFGLNMFLVPQVSAKFGISPSSKLLTNLVLHLLKCVNLVLLTKFC